MLASYIVLIAGIRGTCIVSLLHALFRSNSKHKSQWLIINIFTNCEWFRLISRTLVWVFDGYIFSIKTRRKKEKLEIKIRYIHTPQQLCFPLFKVDELLICSKIKLDSSNRSISQEIFVLTWCLVVNMVFLGIVGKIFGTKITLTINSNHTSPYFIFC